MSLRDDLNASAASALPFMNRRRAAEEITRHLFPVSHRSLEAWALPTRHCNGYAIVATRTLFEIAYAKFASAPLVMGGRRSGTEHQAA